jgi:hypothetical protein
MNNFNDKLEQELKEKAERTKKLQKLLEIYPDLSDKGATRWQRNLLVSELAIKDMVNVSFRHSCGCCSDASLMAMPYIEIEGLTIYATGVWYGLGEKCSWTYGEIPDEGWEDSMRKHGFRDEIIEKIHAYFKNNEPIEDTSDGYSGPD